MHTLTVAIIDDDYVDRLISKRMIERLAPSTRIIEFGSAVDALQYFSDFSSEADKLPDVILLDIRMPIMTGWEYLEQYGKMSSEIIKQPRHYIYTSSIDPEDLISRHEEVYGHYTKPFEQASLLKIIEAGMGQ